MLFYRFLILITSISLLSACVIGNTNKQNANHTDTSTVQFAPIAHAATAEILDFITHFSSASPSQQELVYQDTINALTTQQNKTNLLIKKAIMLALPNSKVRNTTDALTLLNALLNRNDINTSDANLVRLLLIYTQENNELAINIDNQIKMNTSLKQKNKALEQKLNDLKNIEKTMIERNTKTQ
jgi:hypothetical protein